MVSHYSDQRDITKVTNAIEYLLSRLFDALSELLLGRDIPSLFFSFLEGIWIFLIDMFIMLCPRMCMALDSCICCVNELTMGA